MNAAARWRRHRISRDGPGLFPMVLLVSLAVFLMALPTLAWVALLVDPKLGLVPGNMAIHSVLRALVAAGPILRP